MADQKRLNMAVYLDWLLTPANLREPKLKLELANELGISSATLRNYDRDPFLQSQLAKRARATARVDRLPSVLDSLYSQATDTNNPRSVQAARAYLDYLNQSEEFTEMEDLSSVPEERLMEMFKKAMQKQIDEQ